MKEQSLTILAVSDLHYTGLTRQTAQPPDVRGELARILLRKVFLRLEHMGVKPDLTLMLGDLVESGADNNTRLDLLTLHGELTRSGIPFKVIPGNHDVPSETLCEVFDSQPGLFKINGYGLVFFHDNFVAGRDCERTSDDIAMIRKIAAKNPDMPLVAAQHAPVGIGQRQLQRLLRQHLGLTQGTLRRAHQFGRVAILARLE